MRLLPIGYGNFVSAGRILAAVVPDSAPVRRAVTEARKQGTVVDATAGHRTRSVLFMDTGQIVLSALAPETVAARLRRRTLPETQAPEAPAPEDPGPDGPGPEDPGHEEAEEE